jgi:hypothetical protein
LAFFFPQSKIKPEHRVAVKIAPKIKGQVVFLLSIIPLFLI